MFPIASFKGSNTPSKFLKAGLAKKSLIDSTTSVKNSMPVKIGSRGSNPEPNTFCSDLNNSAKSPSSLSKMVLNKIPVVLRTVLGIVLVGSSKLSIWSPTALMAPNTPSGENSPLSCKNTALIGAIANRSFWNSGLF